MDLVLAASSCFDLYSRAAKCFRKEFRVEISSGAYTCKDLTSRKSLKIFSRVYYASNFRVVSLEC